MLTVVKHLNKSRETNLGRYGLWRLLSYMIRTIYFIILEALILNKDKLSCGRNTFTWIGAFRRHTSSRFKSLNITNTHRLFHPQEPWDKIPFYVYMHIYQPSLLWLYPCWHSLTWTQISNLGWHLRIKLNYLDKYG